MKKHKMGLNETWSMAVGGMVGGGIFSVLGVIIVTSGNLAWLSFLISGLIALATAISYSNLTNKFEEGGGAFTYIKDINHEGLAGGLSWLLMMGYILTLSVYAFTFGHYLENMLQFGPWFPRLTSFLIILIFMTFNLRGVGEASWVEVITVWAKLVILFGIAAAGLWNFQPSMLTKESLASSTSMLNAIIGAATIFMAYEGFQLITYDYDDIKNPLRTIRKAEILAVISVIFIYIIVTFGTINLVSKEIIVQKKEVVLAVAGQKVLGTAGLIIASIAALFSTGSAINSTIFATSRLAIKVASDGEMPKFLAKSNENGIPQKAVILISLSGAFLTLFGSLSSLVEAASFIFLITFAVINFIAFYEVDRDEITALAGGIGSIISIIILFFQFIEHNPYIMIFMIVLVIIVTAGRKFIYSKNKN